MKKAVFIIIFNLLQMLVYATPNASIMNITFDKPQIKRGAESVIATITIKNIGSTNGFFYITASAQDGNNAWHDFSPIRKNLFLSSGSTDTVQLQWSPGANVPIGNCYFYTKVFKDSIGADFYTEGDVSNAFSILSNPFPLTMGLLIYHSYSSYGAWDSKLYLYDFSTNTKKDLSANWNIDHAMNAHFSPNASHIVFMGDDAGLPRDWDIYIWDLNANHLPINLTQGNGIRDEDPKISPDGSQIIFKQNGDIKTMALDGSNITSITNNGGVPEESMPYFSSDGQKIVYARGAGASSDIYIINKDGSNNTALLSISNVSEYYPIVRNNSSFLYSRWLSPSIHHDQIHLADFLGNSTSLSINDLSSNNSDAYPVGSDYLFFSSTRAASSGYDIYFGQISSGAVWNLDNFNINSSNEELGACYIPRKFSCQCSP
ncbi:MAG: hypothetical protein M9958_11555 [Chitinophagales bacterium]|nr:hypothetical protein [Chitinophagales bacterium]